MVRLAIRSDRYDLDIHVSRLVLLGWNDVFAVVVPLHLPLSVLQPPHCGFPWCPQMVSAEELRQSIRKFNQKAEELLLQEKHDSARPYLEHVKNLRQELDDLTGGDVLLQLDVPCCLGMLLAPTARGAWFVALELGCAGVAQINQASAEVPESCTVLSSTACISFRLTITLACTLM